MLGNFGELFIVRYVGCQNADCQGPLKQLPINTRSYDLECQKCSERYQVKTLRKNDPTRLPTRILGAAWEPQRQLLDNSRVPSIFLVLCAINGEVLVYFISKQSQVEDCFVVRKPLSERAKSPGWVGFYVEISRLTHPPIGIVHMRITM